MIPPFILDSATPSSERKIFELLEKSSIKGDALHSLNIKPERGDGEADFVLVTRFGILVLEIKGGRLAQSGGHWSSTDRHGVQHRLKQSPLSQAKKAAYRISKDLQDRTGMRFRFGYGVVFPDSGPLPSSTEHAESQVATIESCRAPGKFDQWIQALCDHWSAQLDGRDLDFSDCGRITAELRPSFDAAVPIGRVAAESLREIKRFSEEQLETLDMAEGNPRLLCTGGAGTGKTFLLIELVKREASRGRQVVVCAWSARLRTMICEALAGAGWEKQPRIVGPDDLSQIDSDFADVILVDEGQDLLQMSTIAELDRIALGGLEEGSWRWFMDEQHQAGYHRIDSDANDLIRGCNPMTFKLGKNCRNTEEIVNFTQMLTAADIGRTQVSGRGLNPRTEFFDDGDSTTAIRGVLRNWLDDPQVTKSNIAVLTDDESSIENLDSVLPPGIKVSSIKDFKGLEQDFVIVRIEGHHDAIEGEVLRDLYTGITRARSGLVLLLPGTMREMVKNAALRNHEAMQ